MEDIVELLQFITLFALWHSVNRMGKWVLALGKRVSALHEWISALSELKKK